MHILYFVLYNWQRNCARFGLESLHSRSRRPL